MSASSFALQSAALGSGTALPEVVTGFALTILIGLSAWQMRTLRHVEQELESLTQLVVGYDGTNGLRAETEKLRHEMSEVMRRHAIVDAIESRELIVTQEYTGPDRRIAPRGTHEGPCCSDETCR